MNTWLMISGVLGAIVLIGNVGSVLYKWIHPALELKETVEEHSRMLEEIQKHEKNDLETLKELKETNRMQLKSMLDIINHFIDGNHQEKMKKTRDEIQNMLVDK